MTVAKLMQNGELRVKGIDTRLPLVTDGLVAHYPMDGTTKGISNNNILDYSTWNIGTSGTQTGFSQNGDGNSIVEDVGPFGESQAVWQSLGNDTTSDADGGWNSSNFTIDKTKKYRHSVWIRRKVTGNGTGYFGCLGNQVYNIAANTVNSNTYFWASAFPNNDWLLFVSYVYPHDIGNVVPSDDAGIYTTSKTKIAGIATFKFSPTATVNNHRTYLYYSTLATTNQQWAYPRVDLCDGTEPSIDDLLSGEGNVINPYSESNITKANDYAAIEEATTNYASSGTNGYTVSDISHWNEGNGKYYSNHEGDKQTIVWPTASGSPYIYTHDYVFADDLTTLSGKVVTASLMLRRVEGSATGRIRFYDNVSGYRYQDVSVTKEFKRFAITATVGSSPTRIFFMIDNTGGGTYEFYNVQLEQKAFATEYVNGSRSASGSLVLHTNIGTDDFTITGTFIPNYNSDSLANGSYFLNLGNGFILQTYNGAPFINGNVIAGAGNNNIHLDYNTIVGDEVSYTIKRSGTTFTWNMKDSRQDITWTKVHSNVALISVSSITLSGDWGGVHKNLSIYNRALSDSEVTKISKGTHSFTQDGLITNGINSKPNIPSDAFYYPLDLNSKDEYNLYLPSEDIGNYADGLYVGSGNSVEYNFNSSLGLDWNGDWSICYFKKPIGTYLGETNLTGYNIESFGSNGNTVGGGYLWFGKLNLSNSIEGASNGAFAPDVYFNNWQCVTIIKSGTSVTISTWLTDKISRDRTVVLGTITSNRFVTQYGYDFKLSGWDNTNPCHSYFRDLIVVKRAMTSDELKNYRNVKMKATSDVLYIQNGINSTATL